MRVIGFGDELGLEILKASIPEDTACGIATAEDREAAFSVATLWSRGLSVPHMVHPIEKSGKGYNNFVKWVKELKPDLGIICSYSIRVPEEVINIPSKGILNIHGGLLPEYRGANILNWVLINGEKETGVTIHKVMIEIDTGPIVAIKRVPIEFTDTALSLRKRIAEASITLIKENWRLFCLTPIPAYPQDESRARRWKKRREEDGLIDWNRPATEIYNLIRALVPPWPGAFYIDSNGKKVVIDYFLSLEDVKKLQIKQIGHVVGK